MPTDPPLPDLELIEMMRRAIEQTELACNLSVMTLKESQEMLRLASKMSGPMYESPWALNQNPDLS